MSRSRQPRTISSASGGSIWRRSSKSSAISPWLRLRHEHAALRLNLDQPFGRQCVQGLAQRDAAHLQLGRELLLHQTGAGEQFAVADGRT